MDAKIKYFESLAEESTSSLNVPKLKISDRKNEELHRISKGSCKRYRNKYFNKMQTKAVPSSKTCLKENRVTYQDVAANKKKLSNQNLQTQGDEFGLNDFSNNSNDNYIVEARNKNNKELRITFFGTMKRYITMEQDVNKTFDNIVCEFQEKFSTNIYSNLGELRIENESTNATEQYNETEYNKEDVTIDKVHVNYKNNNKMIDSTDHQKEEKPSSSRKSIFSEAEENVVDYWEILYTDSVKTNPQILKPPPVNMTTHPSKSSFIIKELKKTEETYLNHLLKLLQYQNYLSTLTQEAPYIFANLNSIYDHTRSLFRSLKQATTADSVADAFITHEKGFALYAEFARNESQAKIYLEKYEKPLEVKQKELGEPLSLENWLWIPIQRLGRYILLLENLRNELKKTNAVLLKVEEALHIVKREMRRSNDLIVIDLIKACPIDLTTKGSFLLKEEFKILKPIELEAVVFLFDDIIVITLNNRMPTKLPYIGHIEMKELKINTIKDGKFLEISNHTKVKQGEDARHTYLMEAKTEKIKENWMEILQKVLWDQFKEAKEKQRYSYQDKGKRFSDLVYKYIKKSRPLVISAQIEAPDEIEYCNINISIH